MRRYKLIRTTVEVEKITVIDEDHSLTAEHAIEVAKSGDEDACDDDDFVQTVTVEIDPDYPEPVEDE